MSSPTIITLGCRLNAYEAEQMARHAAGARVEDTVIVNTCAVTSEAVRQAAQAIRKARRQHPEARIVVTGCAAQIEPDRFAAMAEVDHVVGNVDKVRPATFAALTAGSLARVKVDDIMSVRETAPHLADGFGARARAYVEIQNGCDHRCTFCIIPFGRGPSRSVPAGDVVRRVRELVASGTREIVLTGVDITSYGDDLPGENSLGRLVRQILRHIPELERLRLSSIDQVEIDHHLLAAIAEEPRLMPHLHLSLQAGSDLILKRMKRRHLRADAVRFCAEVRRLRPDVALGADLIAGFPTETEPQFEETLAIIDDCGLVHLHVFPFSPRNGTPAARMPQVRREVVKSRAARLRDKASQAMSTWLPAQVDTIVEGVVEQRLVDSRLVCRTPQYAQAIVANVPENVQPGESLRLSVCAVEGEHLLAEACR